MTHPHGFIGAEWRAGAANGVGLRRPPEGITSVRRVDGIRRRRGAVPSPCIATAAAGRVKLRAGRWRQAVATAHKQGSSGWAGGGRETPGVHGNGGCSGAQGLQRAVELPHGASKGDPCPCPLPRGSADPTHPPPTPPPHLSPQALCNAPCRWGRPTHLLPASGDSPPPAAAVRWAEARTSVSAAQLTCCPAPCAFGSRSCRLARTACGPPKAAWFGTLYCGCRAAVGEVGGLQLLLCCCIGFGA